MNIKRNAAIASAGIFGIGMVVVGSYAVSHRHGIRSRLSRRIPEPVAQVEGLATETPSEVVSDVVKVGNLQRRTLVLINKVARREQPVATA